MNRNESFKPIEVKCIGKIRTKNSHKKEEFKKKIRNCFYLQQCRKTNTPFKIEIVYYLRNLFSKDIDNCDKLILDALNGLAYTDDRYCLQINSIKSPLIDKNEYVDIIITPLFYNMGGEN